MANTNIIEVPIITTFEKFRTKMSEILKLARQKSKPIFLTKKGKTEGVIMDTGTYESLVKRLNEWNRLKESVNQAKTKQYAPAQKVFESLLSRYE